MLFILITILLIIIELLYFRIASRYGITDKPNERSSHLNETVRGAGVIFPIAAILWFLLFGIQTPLIIAGLTIIALVSFLDDLFSLSGKLRMLVHFFSVTLLFLGLPVVLSSWYYWIGLYIVFIGWINAFNFMDGINGITPLYSLVSLVSFLFLSFEIDFIPAELLVVTSVSVMIFTIFNAKKRAKAFAGDVGSVSIAFLLGWFMLSLIISTQKPEYILFFIVYGVDSVFTILHRLIKGENLFKAHRSHLYQYLSNELNFSHLTVSFLYAGVQGFINLMTVILIRNDLLSLHIFLAFVLFLSAAYLLLRIKVLKKIS